MIWGLIGASTIAAEHMIAAFRNQPDGQIRWVVSSNDGYAKAFAGKHNIPFSTADLDTSLADKAVNAVYISSTNEKHLPQALAAIAAGKHVLCEKPLAMNLADAVHMVAAAKAKGVVLATNHHLRNAGSHIAIRDLVSSGKIGHVLSMRVHHAVHLPPHLQGWRINDASAGGGVIPDITVHDADTVRFHLGEDPIEVTAIATSSGMGEGVEDSVMSVWAMPSGTQIFSHDSFTHAFAGSGLEIHGTEGSIFARNVMTQAPIGEIELVTKTGREIINYSTHSLYGESVRRFVAAVEGKGTVSASGEDGIKSLAIALAVREAAQNGNRTIVRYGA